MVSICLSQGWATKDELKVWVECNNITSEQYKSNWRRICCLENIDCKRSF